MGVLSRGSASLLEKLLFMFVAAPRRVRRLEFAGQSFVEEFPQQSDWGVHLDRQRPAGACVRG